MSVVEFEWDEIKSLSNLTKHGINFEQAKEIFATDYIIIPAKTTLEIRYIVIGEYRNILYLAIVITKRATRIRIISARRAKTKEIKLFKEFISKN